MLSPITTGLSPVSRATVASMSSRASTSSSTARYRHSSRTSAAITPPTATRPWSIITMQRHSARTMPSTTRTSTGLFSTSLNGTVGASNRFTSVIPCATTRNTFSSTRRLPESNASCRSSTARTTKTLSSPFSQPVSAMAATASARISQAKSSPSQRKTCSNTAPTAPTLSTRSTSVAKNSPSTILSRCQRAAFSEKILNFAL